jgi:hypothetical protein
MDIGPNEDEILVPLRIAGDGEDSGDEDDEDDDGEEEEAQTPETIVELAQRERISRLRQVCFNMIFDSTSY